MRLSPLDLRRFDTVDEIQTSILTQLLENGERVSPRGIPTFEICANSFSLTNPRCRCILNPARRWSLPLAIGELCWHLSGSRQVAALGYYAPVWHAYADAHGEIRGSCYGSRIFGSQGSPTVWDLTRRLLETDAASRRAVLYFNDPVSHLDPSCPDAACATSLQFLVRNGLLDAIVTMRSNDAILGLPYDIFLFTFLQELMAVELGLSLGTYHHFVASLHLYEKHRHRACQILELREKFNSDFSMPPLVDPAGKRVLLESEHRIRAGHESDEMMGGLGEYWRELVEVLRRYRISREKGWRLAMEEYSSVYRPVLEPLVG